MNATQARAARRHDVLIIGAGPAGLSLALSLAPLGLRIGVLDCQEETSIAQPADDGREIALTHKSMRILQSLGVAAGWSADEVAPIRAARVYNGRSARFLDFQAGAAGSGPLGHLVANHCIRREIYRRIREQPGIELLCGRRIRAWSTDADQAAVHTETDGWLGADLLVAADSRHSETRRALGISARMHDFGKTMLVLRASHGASHDGTAMEWFDFGRTIATLPLCGRQSSIILTVSGAEAERLLRQGEAALEARLNRWLSPRLGPLQLVSAVHRYPLVAVYAERFVGRRFALVGDAAVGMHPVTAHGFNFGLSGQSLLAALIGGQSRAGRDIAADRVLARYEHLHRRATWPLYQATNAVARLYTSDTPPARLARRIMLDLGERVAPFKRAIVRELRS
ncbi:MAG: 5-demethoxyubiquinol-8 5-hydroxylase UbiM [Nevskia sp.]|nr:5-demethoxyubiquinol-8 5-hydroxylase UbiM [Nevskia sp.]